VSNPPVHGPCSAAVLQPTRPCAGPCDGGAAVAARAARAQCQPAYGQRCLVQPLGKNNQRSDCPCGIPVFTTAAHRRSEQKDGHCRATRAPTGQSQNNRHLRHQESNTSCKCPDPSSPIDCREPSCKYPMVWFCDAEGHHSSSKYPRVMHEHPPMSQGGIPHSCKLTRGDPRAEYLGCNDFKTLHA
jgi:hypothetical protein